MVETVTYPSRSSSEGRRLDIHKSSDPDAATLVFVHGGGWRAGDRSMDAESLLHPLARAGLHVVSIDYALTGEAPFPANLDDVYCAVEWVVAHGAEHGLDPGGIVLGGGSAGGHLSALAVLRGLHDEHSELVRTRIRGVIPWCPVTDIMGLLLDQRHGLIDSLGSFGRRGAARGWPFPEKLTAMLGRGDVSAEPIGRALDLDPRHHLTGLSARDIPPFLILCGTADDPEIRRDAVRLRDALLSAGAEVDLLFLHEADHQDARFGRPALTGAVVGFANTVTGGPDRGM